MMPEENLFRWRTWLKPGVIIAALAIVATFIFGQFSEMNSRFGSVDLGIRAADTKIDRRAEAIESRLGETNSRVDQVISGQADAAERVVHLQADVTYMRNRLDQIAKKLEVAAAPSAFDRGFVGAPQRGKVEVFNARDLKDGPPGPELERAISEGNVFVLTPDRDAQKAIRDRGGKPVQGYEMFKYEPVNPR